jgi:predicted restriction endonuclease
VSGCTVSAVLRASHIKAWSQSTDNERLDGSNGLLLTADLDALFDRGLISFDDKGNMLMSSQLSAADREMLRLPRPLRCQPSGEQRRYLLDHRRQWTYV